MFFFVFAFRLLFSPSMQGHPTNAPAFTLQGASRRPHLPPRRLSTSRHSHYLHGRQISTSCIIVCGIPSTLQWESNNRRSVSATANLLQNSRLALRHPTICFSRQGLLLASVTSNNKLRPASFGRRWFLLEIKNIQQCVIFRTPFQLPPNSLPIASQLPPNSLPTATQFLWDFCDINK